VVGKAVDCRQQLLARVAVVTEEVFAIFSHGGLMISRLSLAGPPHQEGWNPPPALLASVARRTPLTRLLAGRFSERLDDDSRVIDGPEISLERIGPTGEVQPEPGPLHRDFKPSPIAQVSVGDDKRGAGREGFKAPGIRDRVGDARAHPSAGV